MKTNCRNCKYAEWSRALSGRRLFGNFARCGYVVIVVLPASRANAMPALIEDAGVAQYRDVDLSCAVWEKVVK